MAATNQAIEDEEENDHGNNNSRSMRKKNLRNIAEKLLGFEFEKISKLSSVTDLLYEPTESSSLAIFRILFGFTMFLDVASERGFSRIDERWSPGDECRFPLINGMNPLSFEGMCILYIIMWLGSIGIMLGYKYRASCLAFSLPFWYIILLDKTAWNNHTYLFGLTSALLFFTEANACWSLDRWLSVDQPVNTDDKVPLWNYVILRFQVFLLYFMAGLKKFNSEWLGGHSMVNLSSHTVFKPFKLFLSNEQIDYWIVHVGGFVIDSLSGFGLYYNCTRPLTLIVLFVFHFMNSRLFAIGMFPYVGIVTMFIFCDTNWPRKLLGAIFKIVKVIQPNSSGNEQSTDRDEPIVKRPSVWKRNITFASIILYVCLQFFLPFSHFITKGYNGWSNGLYGYSWDMMVYNWDTTLIRITVVNNENHHEYLVDPKAWARSEKWTKHPDMVVQYATCVKDNLSKTDKHLKNISIYVDVWCSLNGRLYQRMYDPTVDMTTANWSVFQQSQWVMPLLTELNDLRYVARTIQRDIYSKSDDMDVLFLCDFPGLYLDNYINEELVNTSLQVLKGKVIIKTDYNQSIVLNEGNRFSIQPGSMHSVYTVSSKPSCYMYSYINYTASTIGKEQLVNENSLLNDMRKELSARFKEIKKSISFAVTCTVKIFTNIYIKFF